MKIKPLEGFKAYKSDTGKTVYIEGYANKAVADRGNEIIPAKEWNVKNYSKNPIIFFNHDRDFPIGKAESIEVKADGLYIKAAISRSGDKDISRVRDLIEEGILKTFSVGFNPEREVKNEKGELELQGVELLENSVVSIPMNTDSEFSASSKSLREMLKTKSYKEIKVEVLNLKGARVAGKIQARLSELGETQDDFDKLEVLLDIAGKADITKEVLDSILTGENVNIPENVLAAFAETLGIDLDSLKEANAEDSKPEEDKPEEEEDGEKQADQDTVDGVTAEVSNKPGEMDTGNPVLQQAIQTNALLGTLINKFDGLEQSITGAISQLAEAIGALKQVINQPGTDLENNTSNNEEELKSIVDKVTNRLESVLNIK